MRSSGRERRLTLFVLTAAISVSFAGAPRIQDAPPTVIDDLDMYAVYATLLPNEWRGRDGQAKRLVVQQETVTRDRCMPSGPPMDTDWKPVLENFRSANRGSHVLGAGHDLGAPYDLVSSRVIATAFSGDMDGLEGFRRRYPEFGGYLQVSVVGFDSNRQRAMVYVAHYCGGLCGGGSHHLLERVGSTWRHATVPGLSDCGWIA